MSARLRSLLLLIALSGAMFAAVWAQRQLRTFQTQDLTFVALAFVLAFIAGRLLQLEPVVDPASGPSLRPVHMPAVAVCLGALSLTLSLARFQLLPLVQILAFSAAVAAAVIAYVPRDWRVRAEPAAVRATQASLLIVALFALVYALDRIPGGLYGDEGSLGTLVLNFIRGRHVVPPFGVGWAETPTLFTWLEAGGVSLAGASIAGLRLTAAIGGTFAVLAWFGLFRRELGIVVAAVSALLLIASPEHQHISRIALPEAWIRPCAFLALAGLLAGLRSGTALHYVVSGLALGGSFYMASKAVLVPPILLGAALALVMARLPSSLRQWRGAVLVIGGALVALVPQLVFYAKHGWRDLLVGHHARWMETPAPGGPLAHLARVARLLIDAPEVSPFSPFAALFRVVSGAEAAMLVVGLGICLARPRRPIAAFLLGWLVAALGTLWLDSSPNQLHHAILISCLPAAFAAIVLDATYRTARELGARRLVSSLAVATCAAPFAVANAYTYFGNGNGAAEWAGAEFTALGKAMNEYRDTHYVTLVTPPMSWDLNTTLLYLAPDFKAPTKLTALDPKRRWLDPVPRDVAFLVTVRSVPLLPIIEARYPGAHVELRKDTSGQTVLAVVLVPSEDVERAELAAGS